MITILNRVLINFSDNALNSKKICSLSYPSSLATGCLRSVRILNEKHKFKSLSCGQCGSITLNEGVIPDLCRKLNAGIHLDS